MRVFLGIVLGVLLTILVAYVLDAGRPPVCKEGGIGCPLVNWDEANTRFKNMQNALQSAWYHLTGHRD
jgi:hypothetical protein